MSDSAPAPWPTPADTARCPCLSGETFGECCGPFHRGSALAPTAERLMRSRYSAFVVGDADYLLATWDPRTRPAQLDLDRHTRWFGLDIVGRTGGGMLDSTGTVDFIAHFRSDGEVGAQRENSRFVRDGTRWLYLDGR
ncbi:MAG: zinc-binding protein [Glaciihabitans sp.]|nr:zinc-binding protein [Glaciihabitans sp.]